MDHRFPEPPRILEAGDVPFAGDPWPLILRVTASEGDPPGVAPVPSGSHRGDRRSQGASGDGDGSVVGAVPEEPFSEATRPLVGMLISVARRLLGSEDLAWDAVQEALLSLWLTGELPSNPRAWLVRAVVHRSLHLSRCRSRRRRHEDRACQGRPEGCDHDDPARHLEAEELRQALDAALSRLAPEHRSILFLKAIEQMDYEAIAATLQVPLGTVRSRLNRARRALRDVLIPILPEDYHGLISIRDRRR